MSRASQFLILVAVAVILCANSTPAFGQTSGNLSIDPSGQTPMPTISPTPTINNAANQARDAQLATANQYRLLGIILISEGQKQKKNELIIMGIQALLTADQLTNAANQSHATANESKTGSNATADQVAASQNSFADPKVKAAQETLAKAGISIDRTGNVKMPDGSKYSPTSFASSKGLASAGFDPASLDIVQKAAAGLDSGAGVGAGRAMAESSGGGYNPSSESRNYTPGSSKALLQKNLMAGKTVMFDGEPIGVRAGNIFEMVHNCYQRKLTGKEFIAEDGGSASESNQKPIGSK